MRSFRLGWIVVLAGLWVCWEQGDAFGQKVYWTDTLNGKIQSAKLDGTGVTTIFDAVTVLPPNPRYPSRPASIVVDGAAGWIYWTDLFSGIHRVHLDGSGYQHIVQVPEVPIESSWLDSDGHVCLPSGTPGVCRDESFKYSLFWTHLFRGDIQGLVLDRVNNLLYWGPDHPFESPLASAYLNPKPADGVVSNIGSRIRTSNTDGTGVVDRFSAAIEGYTASLAVDFAHGKLYYSSPTSTYYPVPNRLYRANLDGTSREILFEDANHSVCDPRDIKVDPAGGKIYWSCAWGGAIMRANLDGSGRGTFVSGLSGFPGGLALDIAAGKIYVVESAAGRVTRRNLATGSLDTAFLVDETKANPQPRQICPSDTDPNEPCPFWPQGLELANVPPVAKAAASPSSGNVPLAVSFSSAGSSDPDGSIGTYFWNFGDGGTSSAQNPSHTYNSGGVYNATLVVTDLGGLSTSATVTITANVAANQPPVANASGSPSSGFAPLAVSFSSAGSSDPEGGTLTYSWNFGDGGTSTSANPSHTYNSPGTYTSVLTVTDNKGAQGTSSVNISAQEDPNAAPDQVISSVSISPSSVAPGGTITVTDTTKNQGNAQAAASTTFIYFSLDASLDGGDAQIGSRPVDVLNAGSSSSGPTQVTIPGNAVPGTTAFIIVLADGANTVAESNEGNNTRTTPISIAGADLIVSALSAPSSRNDGESLTVKDTTKNQGTAPAAASTTSYYWSTDNVYQSTDTLISSRPVSALSAGASNTGSISWRIPRGTAAGTYYIIARADAANAVPETSETNNFRTWKIDVK